MTDTPFAAGFRAFAQELNERARTHLIGTLQHIRVELKGLARRPGTKIFTDQTTADDWAFHHGGRSELQFNIGVERVAGAVQVRHGVGFSLELSQTLPTVDPLLPKIRLFNEYLALYPDLFVDMSMWHYRKNERSPDRAPSPITPDLAVEGVFIFLGRRQSLAAPDYDLSLRDFDRLIPLYRFVESGGSVEPLSTKVEPFLFRPGFAERRSSTVAVQIPRELNVTLRHNDLQRALHRQLEVIHGAENVSSEQNSGVGTFVDVVVRHPDDTFWFYEIKTGHSPRACIREALGQLLEYANWPGSPKVERLIVVGEEMLDRDGAEYLRRLQKRFALPIAYERVTL